MYTVGQKVTYLNMNSLPFPNDEFADKEAATILTVPSKNRINSVQRYNITLNSTGGVKRNIPETLLRGGRRKTRRARKTRKLRK